MMKGYQLIWRCLVCGVYFDIRIDGDEPSRSWDDDDVVRYWNWNGRVREQDKLTEIVSVEIYDDINTCTKTDFDNLTCPTNVFIMLQLQSFHKLRKVVDR